MSTASGDIVRNVLLALAGMGLISTGGGAIGVVQPATRGVERAGVLPAATVTSGYGLEADADGRWWFVRPDGTRFVSIGVNNVTPKAWNPRPNTQYYNAVETRFGGDMEAWAADTRKLLLEHGFNTLGAWSSEFIKAGPDLVRTPVLYVTGHEPDRCLDALLPGFEEKVEARVREELARYTDREFFLGVFLDNEMAWYGRSGWDNIANYTLLERALDLPLDNPRRDLAVNFLKQKYKTLAALSAAYERELTSWSDLTTEWCQSVYSDAAALDRQEFTTLAAEAFFSKATAIVRRELPGVLILGTRFAGDAPTGVIIAAGKTCDVVAFNDYNGQARANMDLYTRYWLLTRRPIMLTEYSWRGRENQSGNPNDRGAGPVVAGQSERAANYAKFIPDLMATPIMLGAHWFEFCDQSPQGRFDGENSNYGIVDIYHNRYELLLASMKSANAQAFDAHAFSDRVMPSELPKARPVTYTPAQHPGRPPTLEVVRRGWTRDPEIWGAADSSLKWEWNAGSEGGITLQYNTGREYGCGINLYGPQSSALKSAEGGATDLDGYQSFVLDVTAPKGLEILVVMAEAGSGPSSQAEFSKAAGDDGEAYISGVVRGTGQRETYQLPISGLQRQQFHGNQHGGRSIDMKAVRNVGLQLRGLPQEGRVIVHSFRLEK